MNDDSSKTCHVPAEGQNQNHTHNFNQGDNTWFSEPSLLIICSNTGCQVFKRGVQIERFLPKNQHKYPKGNY